MRQILKTKQKEIAMKKRKSYAELEPVKKKNNSVWRGFVIITIMLKTNKKTVKTYIPVSHVYKKKIEGRSRLHVLWSFTTSIEKNFSSLAFHKVRNACYSLRKHE